MGVKDVIYNPQPCTEAMKSVYRPNLPPFARSLVVHANCYCNEVYALHTRVGASGPTMTLQMHREMKAAIRIWAAKVKYLMSKQATLPWTPEQLANSYAGRKKAIYLNALKVYNTRKLGAKSAKVKMFCKADKIDGAARKILIDGKPIKARAIQARSPVYNLAIGQYLKPLESVVYSTYGWCSPTKTPMIVKHYNMRQRAQILREKLLGFGDPAIIPLDASSFDASIKVEHLEMLHQFYMICWEQPHDLQRWLSYRLSNKVTSMHGLKYKTVGKRMSGDFDTAMGNCINMCTIIAACMHRLRVHKWDLLNDGDDCLLVIERHDIMKIGDGQCAHLRAALTNCGITATPTIVPGDADNMEHADACRSRPINMGTHWQFVRWPWRAITTMFTTYKHHYTTGLYKILHTMAICESYANAGVPMLQSYANAAWRSITQLTTDTHASWRSEDYSRRAQQQGLQNLNVKLETIYQPVTTSARLSFAKAYGIEVGEQLAFEWYCDQQITPAHFKLEFGRLKVPKLVALPAEDDTTVWLDDMYDDDNERWLL